MTTRLYTHSDCLKHITPAGHPERVERLHAVTDGLNAPEFDALQRYDAPLGTQEQVLLCHPQSYIDFIRTSEPVQGVHSLDADTHMSVGSFFAALRGVGAVCAAVDAVMDSEITNAFCATRPPGHHAEYEIQMGFCLFGTAAIGARYALSRADVDRVCVVDFDVHHGNGTQDLLKDEPRVLFASSHQMPLWPGTGAAIDTGAHDNIINIPLAPYSTGRDLLDIYHDHLFDRLAAHKPDVLIISAGFDAHENDPLANLNFSTDDFIALSRALCDFANQYCDDRIISVLEGGYDLQALADSVAAHIKVLMEV